MAVFERAALPSQLHNELPPRSGSRINVYYRATVLQCMLLVLAVAVAHRSVYPSLGLTKSHCHCAKRRRVYIQFRLTNSQLLTKTILILS